MNGFQMFCGGNYEDETKENRLESDLELVPEAY